MHREFAEPTFIPPAEVWKLLALCTTKHHILPRFFFFEESEPQPALRPVYATLDDLGVDMKVLRAVEKPYLN